jgi:hypothetical protein
MYPLPATVGEIELTCSMHEKNEKCIRSFDGKLRENNFKNLTVDGRIMPKLISEK